MRARFSKGLAGPNTVALLLTIGLLGALVFGMVTIDSQSRQIAQLSSNSDALREQVKAAGEVPVAPPAKAVVGEPGKDGGQGDSGPPGRAPTTEEVASSVAVYCSTRTDCQGSPGAPSTIPGATGEAGTNGQDSTVPGPVGPTGPASTTPGPKGDTGTTGDDGEPAVSWTFSTTPGGEQTCSRTEPFDPAAPTYACAPTPKEIP